jgi:SAM-dependent methyltransferase
MPEYDQFYYHNCCGRPYARDDAWLTHFNFLAERILSDVAPRTVLDAGCAFGMLVEVLRDRGVEAWGVDISEYALNQARPDIRPYLWQGSVTEPFPQKYDLIVCMEVLEHLPKPEVEQAVANLCRSAEHILFASTPLDYSEPTHYSVQTPGAWAQAFARHGFFREMDLDLGFMAPWAAHFRRKSEPFIHQVDQYERRLWQVNNENYQLRTELVRMQDRVRAAEQRVAESLTWLPLAEARQAEIERLNGQAEQLAAENAVLAQRAADTVGQLDQTRARLAEIEAGAGWRLLEFLRRLRIVIVPPGSQREAFYYRLIGKGSA